MCDSPVAIYIRDSGKLNGGVGDSPVASYIRGSGKLNGGVGDSPVAIYIRGSSQLMEVWVTALLPVTLEVVAVS